MFSVSVVRLLVPVEGKNHLSLGRKERSKKEVRAYSGGYASVLGAPFISAMGWLLCCLFDGAETPAPSACSGTCKALPWGL